MSFASAHLLLGDRAEVWRRVLSLRQGVERASDPDVDSVRRGRRAECARGVVVERAEGDVQGLGAEGVDGDGGGGAVYEELLELLGVVSTPSTSRMASMPLR